MTDDSVEVLVERMDNLKEVVREGQERAEHWREHFDAKLDKRPCIVHEKLLSSVSVQLKGIWFLIGCMVAAIIAEMFKK